MVDIEEAYRSFIVGWWRRGSGFSNQIIVEPSVSDRREEVAFDRAIFVLRTQEDTDYLMAKALQESEQEEARRNRSTVSIHSSIDFCKAIFTSTYLHISRASKAMHNLHTFYSSIFTTTSSTDHGDKTNTPSSVQQIQRHRSYYWFIYFSFCLVDVLYIFMYMYYYYYSVLLLHRPQK